MVPPDYNDPIDPIEIYFNRDLLKFFENMQIFVNRLNDDLFARFITDVKPINQVGSSIITNMYWPPSELSPDLTNYYLSIPQSTSEISSWSELSTIVMLTDIIPINPENLGLNTDQNQTATQTIITDYDVYDWNGKRDQINFFNQGVYRFTDIIGTGTLQRLSLQVKWTGKDNVLRDVLVFDRPITIKMLFIKKELIA